MSRCTQMRTATLLVFFAALTILVTALPCAPALADESPIGNFEGAEPAAMWLRVDKLQGTAGVAPGADLFTMAGSFNLAPAALDPRSDVTLSIDNWSCVFPAAAWKQSGKSNKFSAKAGKVSGSIFYWVGGSSKCTFIFTGKKQDLADNCPSFPNLPVRLVIGAVFDQSVTVALTDHANAFKLVTVGPSPQFLVDQVALKLNTRTVDMDRATVKGKIAISDEDEFDPETTGTISMLVGPIYVEIAPGSLVFSASGTASCTGNLPDGGAYKFSIQDGSKPNKRFMLTLTNVDLSALTNPTQVGLDLSDGIYKATSLGIITMKHNGSATLFTY